MKRIISLLCALTICVCLFASCGEKADNVIKIGLLEPFSGEDSEAGKQEALGVEYAASLTPSVMVDGKEYTVEIVTADSKSNDASMVSAAQDLINQGVVAVIGCHGDYISADAVKTLDSAGVPVIVCSGVDDEVAENNPLCYRICASAAAQGGYMAAYAYENGLRKAYAVAENQNSTDEAFVFGFKSAFETLGGSVVLSAFSSDITDFTAYVASAVATECDVLYVAASAPFAEFVIKSAATNGFDIPIMATSMWKSPLVPGYIKGTGLSVTVADFYSEGVNVGFDSAFKTWLNGDNERLTDNGGSDVVNAFTALGYDAFNTLTEAIKLANSTDKSLIKEALSNVNFVGVTGEIKFDDSGNNEKAVISVLKANADTGLWDFIKVEQNG